MMRFMIRVWRRWEEKRCVAFNIKQRVVSLYVLQGFRNVYVCSYSVPKSE